MRVLPRAPGGKPRGFTFFTRDRVWRSTARVEVSIPLLATAPSGASMCSASRASTATALTVFGCRGSGDPTTTTPPTTRSIAPIPSGNGRCLGVTATGRIRPLRCAPVTLGTTCRSGPGQGGLAALEVSEGHLVLEFYIHREHTLRSCGLVFVKTGEFLEGRVASSRVGPTQSEPIAAALQGLHKSNNGILYLGEDEEASESTSRALPTKSRFPARASAMRPAS